VNVDTLLAAMPGLDRAKATSYLPLMEAAMCEHQITNEMRARMWLAQVGHESLSLRYMEEIASGAAYEGRKDLGNIYPGDGVKYKGRGPIQLTGRANYTAAGSALGLDLVNHPELASNPDTGFRVSAWWWLTHGLNPMSDTGDVTAATRRINGGYNGLSDRQSRYAAAQRLGSKVIPDCVPAAAAAAKPKPQPQYHVAVGAMSDGRQELFVEQPSGEVLHRWNQQDGSWSGWSSLGTPGKG
jgi:predicted chitinase